MRLATIISLGASTVLGVGALIVARVMLPSHAPAPTVAAPVEGVPVVTAASAIPYGATIEARYLKISKLPLGSVPAGAYSSIGAILSQPGGAPIALTPMAPLEPVLASKLSGPGERFTLAAVVGPGMRAYSVGVTEITGVGGHVMPGDRVDVVLERDITPQGAAAGAGTTRKLVSGVVVQNVRVLGVGLNANPTSTQPAVVTTATLEVNVQDAAKLALATQAGTISLALRRAGAQEIDAVRPVVNNDLGWAGIEPVRRSGLRGSPLVRVRHRADPHSPAAAPEAAVTVVSGAASASTNVPVEGGV
jgi:pilus assembly protein CpaB